MDQVIAAPLTIAGPQPQIPLSAGVKKTSLINDPQPSVTKNHPGSASIMSQDQQAKTQEGGEQKIAMWLPTFTPAPQTNDNSELFKEQNEVGQKSGVINRRVSDSNLVTEKAAQGPTPQTPSTLVNKTSRVLESASVRDNRMSVGM